MYFRFPYLKFHIMEERTSNNGREFGGGGLKINRGLGVWTVHLQHNSSAQDT